MFSSAIKKHDAVKWSVDAPTELADASESVVVGQDAHAGRPAVKGAVSETLAVEEPLEIRLAGRRFTVTMRTPGHDEELTAGFLFAEGFVSARSELGEIRRIRDGRGRLEPNVVDVVLNVPAERLRERLKRNFIISSSCGVCGKTSIESVQRRIPPLADGIRIRPGALLRLSTRMREAQQVFSATGGLHAAALFVPESEKSEVKTGECSTPLGKLELKVLREDVGRHNAVDKVVGHALLNGLTPLQRSLLMVSGRLSFEIVQKAAAAGVPVLAAVSAPSSLAVELAEEVGITLVGFLRERGFNIYTCRQRIALC